jgi:hypothetical protein
MPRNIALQYGDVATHKGRERHLCLKMAVAARDFL